MSNNVKAAIERAADQVIGATSSWEARERYFTALANEDAVVKVMAEAAFNTISDYHQGTKWEYNTNHEHWTSGMRAALLALAKGCEAGMSDIISRLRARADEQERCDSYPTDLALDREAADEIARFSAIKAELLAALRCVRSDGRFGHWHDDPVNEPSCICCLIEEAIANAEKVT